MRTYSHIVGTRRPPLVPSLSWRERRHEETRKSNATTMNKTIPGGRGGQETIVKSFEKTAGLDGEIAICKTSSRNKIGTPGNEEDPRDEAYHDETISRRNYSLVRGRWCLLLTNKPSLVKRSKNFRLMIRSFPKLCGTRQRDTQRPEKSFSRLLKNRTFYALFSLLKGDLFFFHVIVVIIICSSCPIILVTV